ncbi:NDP-hexose 2,3-dehydratase family protein [Micromonospora auratinigra]|uniref:Oxidase EvaA n=1 Tax=Micromonospora auratinigra TaxID=261654 RepID=A0A1A8ZGD1_9ACTN|nr:NDP-hexose 2,3-dehydratase family protein [Micromonospora auratinigra]SBT42894.1 oxidase EvaA [Micromonospora auratinigra]
MTSTLNGTRSRGHAIARSLLTDTSPGTTDADFTRWYAGRQAELRQKVDRVRLDSMRGWHLAPDTGNLEHVSGRFFSVRGLHVRSDFGPVPEWYQPILDQPEIGILGILVRTIDGVPHCLMQAKVEPGNCNGVQLSPTVQATRSNYTKVHGGNAVPYLEYFRDVPPERVIADGLQSEQGSWFYRKRNRNMIVEAPAEVAATENFRWLTLGHVRRLLATDNLINMDSRSVLACLPVDGDAAAEEAGPGGDDWTAAVRASLRPDAPRLHSDVATLSWLTDRRAWHQVVTAPVPLRDLPGWQRTRHEIAEREGRWFSVVGVDIEASGREVAAWSQPLLAQQGVGVTAFLVRPIRGVLHVLVAARAEPGYLDVAELGPTVQCVPENYAHLPAAGQPPFLDLVRAARPEQVRLDVELSEEGGRFWHTRNRYQVIEVGDEVPDDPGPGFRWLTLHQLGALVRHSHYVNVQARTLLGWLRSPA